jgi:hypothetical protein
MLLSYWLDMKYFLCHYSIVINPIAYTITLEVKQMSNLTVRSNSLARSTRSIQDDKNNWMNTILVYLYSAQAYLTVSQLCKVVEKDQKAVTEALGYFNTQKLITVTAGCKYKIKKNVTPEDIKIHGSIVQK